MYWIGIDTGRHTGLAVWNDADDRFEAIVELPLYKALRFVEQWKDRAATDGVDLRVIVEDARKRKWIPNSGDVRTEMARRQGAGSVKRDCTIWDEFLGGEKFNYEMIAPRKNATKLSAEMFRGITEWYERTNEHKRDAAMLVFKQPRNEK